jgi:adenylate cyclase
MRGRLRLGQFFALSLVGLGLLLAGLLAVVERGSRHTIGLAAGQVMEQAALRVTGAVEDHLAEAERVLASFEARRGLRVELGAALAAELGPHPQVAAIALTYGKALGYWDEGEHAGELHLAPDERGEVAVIRTGDQLVVRRVFADKAGKWRAERRSAGGALLGVDEAEDPTAALTFVSPARRDQRNRALWSDLSNQAHLRVVTVQKALWSGDVFAGVIKVVLQSERIDAFTRIGGMDGHRVFLFDADGRLVSRLELNDQVAYLDEQGKPDPHGDVRVVPANLPPEVAAVLHLPLVRELGPGTSGSARLDVGGEPFLASVTAFPADRTQGWLVGIVAPESLYLRDLAASRRGLLLVAAVMMLAILLAGALVLRALRLDLGRLVVETTRLGAFDFAPSPERQATFTDVADAGKSLEQAKAALRALGKYAPVDLVRQLFDERLEPVLGAKVQDVTLLFSDIEGFTTISEQMPTSELATALGQYLEVMTGAVHGTGGIIDKYIGDGVMALWNAPTRIPEHPRQACAAALRCQEATAALFASPGWTGRTIWNTRFGLHRDDVSVGHFGAPDRMSYTAMGDGVNLAARLEGLNKQYGTHILVSATVARAAGEGLAFRRVDRVAVKGKSEGVEIFELLGRAGSKTAQHTAYERALEAYLQRRFDEAMTMLRTLDDGPSRVLEARCRRYSTQPPPVEWNGVFVALEK